MLNQEWEIKPRAAVCGQCQQPFVNDQTYISSLSFNGRNYERADCCEGCWNKGNAATGSFSIWRGTFRAAPLPPEVLKKETAESLLRKLIEKNDPQYRNSIFILAVMLERRRILAEKPACPPASAVPKALRTGNATHSPPRRTGGEVQQKNDGAMIRVYEHRRTGETFIVGDPMLSLDRLGAVQEEVSALLSGSEALTSI